MLQRLTKLAFLTLIPTILLAHGSHGNGVMAGFTHPILGVDHNIALLGCGILGYIAKPTKWYLAPLAFILAMVMGGYIGIGHEATPTVEKVIALSVLSIGIMVAYVKRFNFLLIVGVLFVFGFFHGYAHGAEMEESNSAVKYIPGYMLGAMLLAAIGILIGKQISHKSQEEAFITLVGGIIIGCGIMMLLP